MTKWTATIAAVVVAVVAIGLSWRWYDQHLAVKVPEFAAPTHTSWLPQNWKPEERSWFHHADQGTQTFGIPYEWFVALDRPNLFTSTRLAEPAYLDRFGFIPDPGQPNPVKLPIGFAHGDAATLSDGTIWRNPQSNIAFTTVGLTCAACHTGRLTYQGQEFLIDGAPALTNLLKFRQATGEAVLFALNLPWRFDAFQKRVLGPNANSAARTALKAQMSLYINRSQKEVALINQHATSNIEEGFGRLDALNRIGNQVFAMDLDEPANYTAITAPVHFPRIWDSSWFTWVQYNGSIQSPMIRNAGEALGVSAPITSASGPTMFNSGVKVRVVDQMERQLAGATPPNAATGFTGLRPPQWKDTPLPRVNKDLAKQGADLYAQHCQMCHMAPISTPEFWTSPRWVLVNPGDRRLDVELFNVSHIGTDPSQAAGMANRTVQTPAALGLTSVAFGPALGQLVGKVVDHWYDAQQPPTSPVEREHMNGFPSKAIQNGGIQAKLAYKVRPLDGIWASPPYLHNGSVPTLYDLLSPKRPTTFYLGRREYDYQKVGYNTDRFKNGFLFDTRKPGNSNEGHWFTNSAVAGKIGPQLSKDKRMALIEYLKTL